MWSYAGAASRLLPTALNAVKAVAAGIVPQLARLAAHDDASVRLKAVQALGIIFVHPSARAAFIDGASPVLAAQTLCH